jgi:hypothetical protein
VLIRNVKIAISALSADTPLWPITKQLSHIFVFLSICTHMLRAHYRSFIHSSQKIISAGRKFASIVRHLHAIRARRFGCKLKSSSGLLPLVHSIITRSSRVLSWRKNFNAQATTASDWDCNKAYILDFAQLWRRYNIVYLGYPNKNGLDYGVHVWVAVGLVRPPENHLSAAALIKS